MLLNFRSLKAVGQGVLVGSMLTGFFLAGAPSARANDDCNRKVNYAKWQLHEAIEDYGYGSSRANYWRHELNEAYEYCRGFRENEFRENRNVAFDNGFRDGMNSGLKDLRQGKYYKPERHDAYEDGDRGYHGYYGDRDSYKSEYREGFLRGYQRGFNGDWR
jgi:hypothetical protein